MNNEDGKFDKGRYTSIPETNNIKLPINKEKIRLGIRIKNERGIEYPKETDYFVCPKVVRDVFGEEPTELTVFFPVADRKKVFPQNYEKYGSNEALQCQGDGEESAQRLNLENGSWKKVKCPCEHYNKKYDKETKIGGCVKAGYLKFMIPSVSIGTFYQCRVGGTVSIEECNSAFELANVTTGGHWAMIPFRMKRVPKKLKIPGTANMKTHWVVTLEIAASTEEIRRVMAGEILYLGQLKNKEYELETAGPAEGKEDDAVVEPETEEEAKLRETKEAEQGEALKEDIEESRAREAQLKKDREGGKDKLKTYKESKTIYKKRVEEENKVLEVISKKAQEAGIDSFEELVNFALDRGIFKTQLTEHLATRVLATNKDVGDRLLKALEEISESKEGAKEEETPKKEIPEKDKEKILANLFDIAQKAGLKNWEEIIGEGCRTKIGEEYVFDIPTTLEEAKEILVSNPEALKKMVEIFTTMARATN